MKRRAAIVGCGDIASIHVHSIAEAGSELVAVCDTDPERVRGIVPDDDRVRRYTSHRDLLADGGIDVVHICTPHDAHVPIALDALDAGLHVLTEKPVAASLADADRLVAAAATATTKVGVCYQNRYNPPAREAKRLLDSGELGRILGAGGTVLWHRTAEYYQDRPWRGSRTGSGGGVLINQAIHTLDLVQWLVGEVTAVGGTAGTYGLGDTIEVEDSAILTLTHADGVRSTFIATNLYPYNAPVAVEVVTEGGLLRVDSSLTLTRPDGTVEVLADGRSGAGARGYWGVSHPLLIADFHAGLDRPEPFWIGPAEAYRSLWILKQVLGY